MPDRKSNSPAALIETRRFVLRPLAPSDASPRYLSWLKDKRGSRYIVTAKDVGDLKELRRYIEEKTGRLDVMFLGIYARAGGEHIGNIKYEPVDPKGRRAVMGILIGEKRWRGRGVAGEVIGATGLWLRDNRNIREIWLGVDQNHAAAIKAYEKIGFRQSRDAKFGPIGNNGVWMCWELPASV